MRRLLALLPFLLVVVVQARAETSPEALIAAGHWKLARTILEPRLRANPSDLRAAFLLSQVKAAFGDLEGARTLAQQAATSNSGNARYQFQLATVIGEMAAHASMFAAARLASQFKKQLDVALALAPHDPDILEAEMEFCNQAPGIMGGDKAKARDFAQQILLINPARGYLAQAELASELKQPGALPDLYAKAVGASPQDYEVRAQAAAFYARDDQQKFADAESNARAALALDPGRVAAYSVLARVYAERQETEKLQDVLSRAEKNIPDDLAPNYAAAQALLTVGKDLPRAEACVRKYLATEPEGEEPDAAQAHRLLGLILEREGKRVEAQSEVENALALKPNLRGAKDDLQRIKNAP
jgi:Tetratricopeptide repeat